MTRRRWLGAACAAALALFGAGCGGDVAELQKGSFTIRVPVLGEQKYKMIYTGRSISYGLSLDRCFGRFTAKFIEPNPTDRK